MGKWLQVFINEHLTSNEIIYVIGGKSIYDQLIPYSAKLIISQLHANYDCELFMDILNWYKLLTMMSLVLTSIVKINKILLLLSNYYLVNIIFMCQ